MAALVKRSLKAHEEIIEAGIKSFIDVGQSLMAIRDERLYEKSYDSFEQYCQKRWGFKKSYAYDLIESAVVVHDLSAIADTKTDFFPQNESQARAVADAAPDAKTRAVVWEAAVESAPRGEDGKPRVTAAVVKKAAAAITGKGKPKPHRSNGHAEQPLPIPEREPGEDPPEPQHDPARPTDKSGNALPDRPELLKAFSSRDLFVSSEKARSVIYNNAYEIAKRIPDGDKLLAAMEKMMKALFHTMQSFEPAYVCKGCNGGKCAKCQKRGYVTTAR